jgi:hypothetical protein
MNYSRFLNFKKNNKIHPIVYPIICETKRINHITTYDENKIIQHIYIQEKKNNI